MNHWTVIGRIVVASFLLAAAEQPLRAQNSASGGAPTGVDAPPVLAAQFDGQRITSADVARIMAVLFRGTAYTADQLPRLQAQALEFAIDRRLVRRYVQRASGGADKAQVDALLERQKREVEKRGLTFEEYLQKAGTTEADLRQSHAWNLAWNSYLEKTVNDDTLQDFFQKNRAEYDGTAVRVRHVLLRTKATDGPDRVEFATQRAIDLRRQITAGKIDFETAARKYSAGPSRRHGGDLGFITRHGQMVEPFARAAFQLKPGEISQPVVTNFGVHIIECVEVRPGELDLRDADQEQKERLFKQLRAALMADTYKKIAALQRAGLEIEYADGFPHFEPGTQQLAPFSP